MIKAIVMSKPGTPEVLQLQDVPPPQITQPQQIMVKPKAAGINPKD